MLLCYNESMRLAQSLQYANDISTALAQSCEIILAPSFLHLIVIQIHVQRALIIDSANFANRSSSPNMSALHNSRPQCEQSPGPCVLHMPTKLCVAPKFHGAKSIECQP